MTHKRRGRPLIHGEPASAQIHLWVTPAQRLELRRVADENNKRLSAVVREAVDEFVGDYRDHRVFRYRKG